MKRNKKISSILKKQRKLLFCDFMTLTTLIKFIINKSSVVIVLYVINDIVKYNI